MKRNIWLIGFPLFISILLMTTVAVISGCGNNPTGGGASGGGAAAASSLITRFINFTNPYRNETGVFINHKLVVQFATDMDPSSFTGEGFVLINHSASVPGTVEYDAYLKCLMFKPTVPLTTMDLFSAVISSDVMAVSGQRMGAPYTWSFTTSMASDSTAPTFLYSDPESGEANVDNNKELTIVFDKPVCPESISSETILIKHNGITAEGTFDYKSSNVHFTPNPNFTANTTYEVIIKGGSNGIVDLTETPMVSDHVFTFSTGTGLLPQQEVSLCTASEYAILAMSYIHNVGTSEITGEVGVSPGADISGFPPGTIEGTTHVADAAAAAAVIDGYLAYLDISKRASTQTLALNTSYTTLMAGGVYSSVGNLHLSGLVTLDGGGEDDALFLIKVTGSLVVDPGCKIMLANGTLARHILWMVNVSADLGANSVFIGNMIVGHAVTILDGTTVIGSVLSDGSVTLDNCHIMVPDP